jgi:DNA-binding transcriptional ArsR family regulator
MPRTLPEPSVGSFDLTVILSALADPGRRALMAALYHCPEPTDCAVLVEKADLGLSSSTISHHYRVLREAGLIRSIADGRKRIVSVRREEMEKRFPGLLQAVLGGREPWPEHLTRRRGPLQAVMSGPNRHRLGPAQVIRNYERRHGQ